MGSKLYQSDGKVIVKIPGSRLGNILHQRYGEIRGNSVDNAVYYSG